MINKLEKRRCKKRLGKDLFQPSVCCFGDARLVSVVRIDSCESRLGRSILLQQKRNNGSENRAPSYFLMPSTAGWFTRL